ncbi:hypothetical protein [Lactobacillus gasseri]|uniref:hypothetical protein n=1 Tax=Lactobacillus gasseri TaxID=1596 RepID=UPI0022E51EEF|nr:hypothetical protein [Lactobacillus gasseri]
MNRLKNKYVKYALGIVGIIILVIVGFRIKQNGGSINPPKKISFVKQAKGSGNHIWLRTAGMRKDAIVYDVVYLSNGKLTSYTLFNKDYKITLGKVSKMSDAQILSLAKKEDRKFFDNSLSQVERYRKNGETEIAALVDNNRSGVFHSLHVGPWLYIKTDSTKFYLPDGPERRNVYKLKNPRFATVKEGDKYEIGGELDLDGDTDAGQIVRGTKVFTANQYIMAVNYCLSNFRDKSDNDFHKIEDPMENNMIDGLIANMKETKYIPPKAYPLIKVKNGTDASGNNLVNQTVNYYGHSYFAYDPVKVFDWNWSHLPERNRNNILNLFRKDPQSLEAKSKLINTAFDKSYNKNMTKNMFGQFKTNYRLELNKNSLVSQQIFDSKYIGYNLGERDYLVTKAQTPEQKATLSN